MSSTSNNGSWSPISALNLINQPSPDISPEDLAAELDLWTNAHFSFDKPPGFALGEEKDDMASDSLPHKLTSDKRLQVTQPSSQPDLNSISFLQSLTMPFSFDMSTVPVTSVATSAPAMANVAPSDVTPATKKRRKSIKDSSSKTSSPSIASPKQREEEDNIAALSNLPSIAEVAAQVKEANPELPDDEIERLAIEEDKRRRNTAASARFRIKKKQREQALEKAAKENAQRVDQLVERVKELEKENKWLRGLIVDKSDQA